MSVDADNELVPGAGQAKIQRGDRVLVSVVDQAEVFINRRELPDDRSRAVGRHAVHDEDLDLLAGVVLPCDSSEALAYVHFLVSGRNDDAHGELTIGIRSQTDRHRTCPVQLLARLQSIPPVSWPIG